MTITQIEYIIAVDTYRNFNVAARKCFVSQPTLSMQIQKLEEELGVKLFERAKQPVVPTAIGIALLEQARITLCEFNKIRELVSEQDQVVDGELSVGMIPTIAPYILPKLITGFKQRFPAVKLVIWEQTTAHILQQVKNGMIDCGLISGPIEDTQLMLHDLFTEQFVAYTATPGPAVIDASSIRAEELWLLDEGHCMRDQVLNFCQRRDDMLTPAHYEYKTGSIETLKRMVDENGGTTILPELAIADLSGAQRKKIRYFNAPVPARHIGLVTQRSYLKRTLVDALKTELLAAVSGRLS